MTFAVDTSVATMVATSIESGIQTNGHTDGAGPWQRMPRLSTPDLLKMSISITLGGRSFTFWQEGAQGRLRRAASWWSWGRYFSTPHPQAASEPGHNSRPPADSAMSISGWVSHQAFGSKQDVGL